MATRKQFLDELAKHEGAALDMESMDTDFHIDAPRGKVWRANGCHCLTAPHLGLNNQSFRGDAYADLIERMRYGTEPCATPDCDMCEAVMAS